MMIFDIDTIDIVGMAIVFIGVCVLSPTMLFALHQFYLIRGARIMKFRNSPIIIAMNILIVLGILERAYHSVIVIWEIEIESALSTINAERTFIGVFIPSIYLLIALRTWLLYFEQRYQLSVASAAWKRLINERAGSWFIAHRQTLGNWKYLLRAGCLPSLCYIALCVAAEIVVVNHWTPRTATTSVVMAGSWTLHALPLLFSCVIYYRFHSKELKDLYRISTEIKYQCATIVVYEVLKVTDVVFFVAESVSTDPLILRDLGRLEAVCSFAINCFFLFALSVFTSAYPVYIHLMTDHGRKLFGRTDSVRIGRAQRRFAGISNIAEVIRHREGFEAIMEHLLLEFSTQNLLFLVELVRIKYAFQLQNQNAVITPTLSSFTPCIEEPLSPINHVPTRSNTVSAEAISEPVLQRIVRPSNVLADDRIDDNADVEDIDISNKIESETTSTPHITSQSAIGSGSIRKLSDDRETTKTANSSSAVSGTAPKPLNVSIKVPGMYTHLFRDNSLFMKLELPPGFPPSTELEEVESRSSLSLQFEHIFLKFIRPGALHEVTLPHQLRSDLCTFFEQKHFHSLHNTRTECSIFNIFDEAALEILELTMDSFRRFTSKEKRIQIKIGKECS